PDNGCTHCRSPSHRRRYHCCLDSRRHNLLIPLVVNNTTAPRGRHRCLLFRRRSNHGPLAHARGVVRRRHGWHPLGKRRRGLRRSSNGGSGGGGQRLRRKRIIFPTVLFVLAVAR
ncbi:unnamed protein product, partial [Ectocarpus sp. 12 AP-2014]